MGETPMPPVQTKSLPAKGRWYYSLEEPEQLAADLRAQLLPLDALPAGTDNFGDYFETSGPLKGPSGKTLRARAIWMTEHLSGETRLITLLPDKSR